MTANDTQHPNSKMPSTSENQSTTETELRQQQSIIEMENISKRFGRVQALDGVDLSLRENEILGLLGDNGSGKSTLTKVLVGIHVPNTGEIRIRGIPQEISSPKNAQSHGIATVYQDLALVNEQSIAENMFLGRTPVNRLGGVFPVVDWKDMNDRAERILRERLNININPQTSVEYLSGGERQAIAIARALVTDPDIIVMDEPTSALSADSATRVQELIQTLREEGISIILISHSMDEVFSLTDRVTVLDNGSLVGTIKTSDVDRDDVVRMMIDGQLPRGVEEDSDFTQ